MSKVLLLLVAIALTACAAEDETQILNDPSTGLVLVSGTLASNYNFLGNQNVTLKVFNDTDADITEVNCEIWPTGIMVSRQTFDEFELASGQNVEMMSGLHAMDRPLALTADWRCSYRQGFEGVKRISGVISQ